MGPPVKADLGVCDLKSRNGLTTTEPSAYSSFQKCNSDLKGELQSITCEIDTADGAKDLPLKYDEMSLRMGLLCEGKSAQSSVVCEPSLCIESEGTDSILCIESLPCDSYKDMGFPREWMIPLLPCGGKVDSENEFDALRAEIAALRDRVSELEQRHSSPDTMSHCAVMEKSTRYVSAVIINIDSHMDDNIYSDAEVSSMEPDCDCYSESLERNESVEPSPVCRTNTTESSEGNESVKQSVDAVEDSHFNESVEPREETSKLDESGELSVKSEASASDVDLSNLFGESSSQIENENENGSREGIISVNPESEKATENSIKCALCKSDTHSIWKCGTFKSYNLDRRWKKAKELGLCFRCLGIRHKASSCKKTKICGINKCRLNHATLLHDETRRKMLRDLKTRKSVDGHISPPVADAGVSDGLFDSARNDEDEPPDHSEPSGGENGEVSELESLVPCNGHFVDHDVTQTKLAMDLSSWLMPIPTVDPGGS